MAYGETDHYETLGVPRSASTGEIRRAYRKLARQYHPDLNPGDELAEERFRKVQEAYSVLIDPSARAICDAETASSTTDSGSPHPATGSGSFAHAGPASARAAGQESLRDPVVPYLDNKEPEASGDLLRFLLRALPVCALVMCFAIPIPEALEWPPSLVSGQYWVLVPIAMFFLAGLLFGGGRASLLARSALINGVAWCFLVLCWRTAHVVQWSDILHVSPWALPSHLPIIVGAMFRRGKVN